MSSEGSREHSPYRDSSPTSPSSPISTSAFPQWLRQTRPRAGILASGRVRILLIALGCMALGWMLTSTLGPVDEDFGELEAYDMASGGVLDDPTGFGVPKGPKLQPGILGDTEPKDEMEAEFELAHSKQPSVTGALSELHDAVKDKLKSWSPYAGKNPGASSGAHNDTASGKHKPANATAKLLAGEAVTDGISEADRLGARTRIGKCTILFNGNTYWERAIRTHERHDKEHGYRLHVLRQHLMDDVWSKPAYILSLILRELAKPESERLEWLFWVDADTIILNPYIPIEVFLPPPGSEFDDVHLMFSNDWNGLNNGVFPVRVNQWSAQLFSAIVAFRHYRPESPLVFRDQSAMDTLMHESEFADNVVQAPQRWFNAYQGEHNETLAPFQIRRGDFLVHFAGVPNREERMGYWLERAEQHLDDWEVPVKSTSYPQEVKDFWWEQGGLRRTKKEALAAARLKSKELTDKVEEHLNDYSERLSEEQQAAIKGQREEVNRIMEDSASTLDKMEEAIKKLEEMIEPLTSVISEAQKSLLNSAHEAIFAGEKDLLENGFSDGVTSAELNSISDAVKNLKYLVMMPQENWNRHDITSATNEITEARARLRGKYAAEQAAKEKEETDKKKAADELSELQKQVAAEANAASATAAADGPPAFAAASADALY